MMREIVTECARSSLMKTGIVNRKFSIQAKQKQKVSRLEYRSRDRHTNPSTHSSQQNTPI